MNVIEVTIISWVMKDGSRLVTANITSEFHDGQTIDFISGNKLEEVTGKVSEWIVNHLVNNPDDKVILAFHSYEHWNS